MKRPPQRRSMGRQQQGFTLLELMIVIVIAGMITASIAGMALKEADRKTQAATATQINTYANAVAKYTAANSATLLATTGPATPVAVSTGQLVAGNFLDASYSDITPYNQQIVARVLQTTPGKLDPIVMTTGGLALNDVQVHNIAGYLSTMGGNGGFIDSRNAAVVRGVGGWWTRTAATYGVAPGVGHVAAGVFILNSAVVDDYLHRTLNSNPALNTMSTNILMAGNAIQGVSDVRMNAANQGMTFYGGGEKIVGTSAYGISFQTNYTERLQLANDGTLYLGNGGSNGRIDANGNIWLKQSDSLLIGSAQFYADGSNILLSSPAVNGTVYIRGGGVSNPWSTANLDVYGNISAQNINAAGNVSIGGSYSGGDYYANGWFRLNGATGVYWQSYGGGWVMYDSSTIQAYGGKNISTSGNITGNRLVSNEYVQINGPATAGQWCDSSSGALFGKNTDGSNTPLYCSNWAWQKIGGDSMNYYFMGQVMNQTFSGSNNTGKTMWIIVSNWGDNCGSNNNDYGANIYVNGNMVGQNIDFNVNYAKVKTETFPVPVGGNYQVIPYRYICNVETRVWEYR